MLGFLVKAGTRFLLRNPNPASDCHLNPGPRRIKYPCGICGKACVWSKTVRSVACSSCENWFHKDCLNMPTANEPLEQTEVSWYCCTCGLPNFCTSLYEEMDASHTACSTPSHTSVNSSIDSSSNIGSPRYASSPKQHRSTPLSKRKIRILVINFQSLRSKRESFWAMLEYCEPDIVLATETWLNQTIAEREILPENYRFVARRDRPNSTYGGVAIIAKHDLDATEIDLKFSSELMDASFYCKDLKKPVVVCSLYRPTDNNLDYSQELCSAVTEINNSYKDHILWLGGDANLPDIDWKTDTITGHGYPASINHLYTDTINDIGCE